MSAAVRLGLVGCGRIAELGYLPAIAQSAAVELVAVADPDAGRRTGLASQAAGTSAGSEPSTHASLAELLSDAKPDAAIVARPPGLHLEHAAALAQAGIPCLVEKPPASNVADAQALAGLDPQPWIAFNRRFRQGRELAAAVNGHGRLEIDLDFRYRRASWRPHTVRDDALLDLGSHLVDLAIFLGGEPVAVERATLSEERAELVVELGHARVRIGAATDRPYRERAVVRGAGGRVLATSDTGGVVRATLGRLSGSVHPLVASLRAQLEAFARAIAGGDPSPLASAAEGVRAMSVLEAAREAAREGTRVPVPPSEAGAQAGAGEGAP